LLEGGKKKPTYVTVAGLEGLNDNVFGIFGGSKKVIKTQLGAKSVFLVAYVCQSCVQVFPTVSKAAWWKKRKCRSEC